MTGRQTAHSAWPRSLYRALFSFAAAFVAIMLCSKSSFLYPINDWVDVNCFFTVGRGIRHGLVPYLDLYDQKGPLLYFAFALASLISESSFAGVFIIEVVSFWLFLYLAGRTAQMLSGSECAFFLAAAALGIGVPLSNAFRHGGSAEQLFLPALMGALYLVLRAMQEKRPLRAREGFVLGALAGAALFTKYTFCGLFVGLALAVLIWYIIEKQTKRLPGLIAVSFAGFAAVIVPVVIWYALRGGLSALWQAYFMDNLTQYSKNIRSGNYPHPLLNLFNNLPWSIPGMAGILWCVLRFRKRWRELLTLVLGAVALYLATYFSGRRYPYYALVLCVFAPVGFAALFDLIPQKIREARLFKRCAAALVALLCALSPLLALKCSDNVYLMKAEKSEIPPFIFAETIRQSEDRSLLNYGFLDYGFYFAAETQPVARFFCTLNNDLPEEKQEHETLIREGKVHYIITREIVMGGHAGRKAKTFDGYEVVAEASFPFEGLNCKYRLYERQAKGL